MVATVEHVTKLNKDGVASFETTQIERPNLEKESSVFSLFEGIGIGAIASAAIYVLIEGLNSLAGNISRKQFLEKIPSEIVKGSIFGSIIGGLTGATITQTKNAERAQFKPYIEELEQHDASLHALLPVIKENAENKTHIAQLEKERAALLAQIPDGVKR